MGRTLTSNKNTLLIPAVKKVLSKTSPLLASPNGLTTISIRTTSFVGKVTADDLWRSATSVSNAGRKRGRAKGLRRRVDLNKGQRLGVGRAGTVFPGLTGPAMTGKQLLDIHQSQVAQESVRPIPEIPKKKRLKLLPLQRGFSGTKMPGRSIGPPDPINDYVFENFDTKVLEYKMVNHMTGNLGRKMRFSALVVTGNKNGLVGYAVSKAPMGPASLRKAKNVAGQRLQYIQLYNDHTVFHNFFVQEGGVKLFVEKMPKGYGLKCHRIIKTICEIIGIKDLYAKCEGTTNPQAMTKGFIRGLLEQETHQQLADRKKLHVVEFRPEMDNVPVVVASPSDGQVTSDPITDVTFDFENMYYEDGKIRYVKTKDPLQEKSQSPGSWKAYMKKEKDRNQIKARYERIIYGLEPSKEELKIRMKPLK